MDVKHGVFRLAENKGQFAKDPQGRAQVDLFAESRTGDGSEHVIRTMDRAELFDLMNTIERYLDRKKVVLMPSGMGGYSYTAHEYWDGVPYYKGAWLGYYTTHNGLPFIVQYEGTTILDPSEFEVVARYERAR